MARRHSKVLLYDESGWTPPSTGAATQAVLSLSWMLGTKAFRGRSEGASSWTEALDDLAVLQERHEEKHNTSVRELHVWGHGSRGLPHIGPRGTVDLERLHKVCPALEVIWWRSCSVHASQEFAAEVVELTGATSVGHCVVISAPNPFRQRAVCGLRPGEQPHWKKVKGVWRSEATGLPLPSVATFRNRVPYNHRGAWIP